MGLDALSGSSWLPDGEIREVVALPDKQKPTLPGFGGLLRNADFR